MEIVTNDNRKLQIEKRGDDVEITLWSECSGISEVEFEMRLPPEELVSCIELNFVKEPPSEFAMRLCDFGILNSVIRGYLIQAMRNVGIEEESITKATVGLYYAFDELSAKQADAVSQKRE